MADLYSGFAPAVMQHYRQSRFRGTLIDAEYSVTVSNPLCGDQINLTARIAKSQIGDNVYDSSISMRFEARGCVLSQAMASLFLEYIEPLTVSQIKALSRQDFFDFALRVLVLHKTDQKVQLQSTEKWHTSVSMQEKSCVLGQEESAIKSGDITKIIGPTRQRCVLLIFDAVQRIVNQIEADVLK